MKIGIYSDTSGCNVVENPTEPSIAGMTLSLTLFVWDIKVFYNVPSVIVSTLINVTESNGYATDISFVEDPYDPIPSGTLQFITYNHPVRNTQKIDAYTKAGKVWISLASSNPPDSTWKYKLSFYAMLKDYKFNCLESICVPEDNGTWSIQDCISNCKKPTYFQQTSSNDVSSKHINWTDTIIMSVAILVMVTLIVGIIYRLRRRRH